MIWIDFFDPVGFFFFLSFIFIFSFFPLLLRINQNLERSFQVCWSCLCVGFFVFFICFFVLFVLCLNDSEETYRTEKRCWQKHRSQKICHNFSFCSAKQLKYFCGFCTDYIFKKRRKIKFKLQVNCINNSRFAFPETGMELDSWQEPMKHLGIDQWLGNARETIS